MMDVNKPAIAFVFALLTTSAFPFTLPVGPGKTYARPSLAAAAAKDGDTVEIATGLYEGDACVWRANNLTLRAPGPYAHLEAKGAVAQGKAIWVITGANTVVENIEFSGAAAPDQNGAGIRQEGANLIVRHCYFHDNEDGILTGADSNSDITIEHSEFARNGFGDGYTHNMYIGQVKSFTLRYCYTHHAKVGHNIKSRALKNYILCNRSLDGLDGTASYELDFPNGGPTVVAGNVFQQGPATQNPTILTYGEEGLSNPGSSIQIINNTFVNDKNGSGDRFINLAAGTTAARVMNNLFVGNGIPVSGATADTSNNLATQTPGFYNRAAFDYRLTAASPAIDKGKDPGLLDGLGLLPALEFLPPDVTEPRVLRGPPDIGAYEYDPAAGLGHTHGFLPRPGPQGGGAQGGGPQGVSSQSGGVQSGRLAGSRMLFLVPEPIDGLGRAAVF